MQPTNRGGGHNHHLPASPSPPRHNPRPASFLVGGPTRIANPQQQQPLSMMMAPPPQSLPPVSPPAVADRSSSFEPPEVFCGLGSLIVEGRVPIRGSDRGFGEGPHVPGALIGGNAGGGAGAGAVLPASPAAAASARLRHECSSTSVMVSGSFILVYISA